MIAWGVKLKKNNRDDMQIVSNMAKAHVKVREDSTNEVYKLAVLDSGEPVILDGPLVVVDSYSNLYGMPGIIGHVIVQILIGVLFIGLLVAFVVTNNSFLLVSLFADMIIWVRSAISLRQAIDERVKYVQKFLIDLANEIGN